MGISADLKQIVSKEEFSNSNSKCDVLNDHGCEISLYDLFPSHFHEFIDQFELDVFNYEFICEKTNEVTDKKISINDIFLVHITKLQLKDGSIKGYLEVTDKEYENDVVKYFGFVQDAENYDHPEVELKIEKATCNVAYPITVVYLGSAGMFVDNIYELYNENGEDYPYIFQFNKLKDIYNLGNGCLYKSLNELNKFAGKNYSKFNSDFCYIDLGY